MAIVGNPEQVAATDLSDSNRWSRSSDTSPQIHSVVLIQFLLVLFPLEFLRFSPQQLVVGFLVDVQTSGLAVAAISVAQQLAVVAAVES